VVVDGGQRPGRGAADARAQFDRSRRYPDARDRHAFRGPDRWACRPGRQRVPLGRVRSWRMGERVFDGLKVIDCASFIAGPAAATVMSDFGAEVIKIEPPGMGDPYRRRATPSLGPGLKSNPGFELDGRNKKSLALDLRSPAGPAVLRRLVAQADVFITHYPPPVRRRLAIPFDDLSSLNP